MKDLRLKPDVGVIYEGTLIGFSPRTEKARAWIKDNLVYEPWQIMGDTFFVDRRTAWPIITEMRYAGLAVAAARNPNP